MNRPFDLRKYYIAQGTGHDGKIVEYDFATCRKCHQYMDGLIMTRAEKESVDMQGYGLHDRCREEHAG